MVVGCLEVPLDASGVFREALLVTPSGPTICGRCGFGGTNGGVSCGSSATLAAVQWANCCGVVDARILSPVVGSTRTPNICRVLLLLFCSAILTRAI